MNQQSTEGIVLSAQGLIKRFVLRARAQRGGGQQGGRDQPQRVVGAGHLQRSEGGGSGDSSDCE